MVFFPFAVRAIYRDDGARYGDAFAIYLTAKPSQYQ